MKRTINQMKFGDTNAIGGHHGTGDVGETSNMTMIGARGQAGDLKTSTFQT